MEMSLKQYIPLSVSAERVFQAIEAIKYAKAVGARRSHGSTGAEMTKSS
jgi:hypothetical protein